MTASYRVTPAAQRDVESILLEVEVRFGSIVADRVYDDFLRAFRLLGRMPNLGHLRLDLWPEPFRFWPLGPSLIAYRADVRPIQIVRIARASRDWAQFVPRE